MAESIARKQKIRKMDLEKLKKKTNKLDEFEAETKMRTMHLLERANNLKLEQEEEMQLCNKLILETKCRAIRDLQVIYNNNISLFTINKFLIKKIGCRKKIN